MMEAVCEIHRAVRGDIEVREKVLGDERMIRVMQWVLSKYRGERSDKAKLEAILELMVWSQDRNAGLPIKYWIDEL
jgi:hypothetical protein